jgi:hypothetical protein
MTLQMGRTLRLTTAVCVLLAMVGCASGVKRPETYKTAVFKPSAETPIGLINVAATSEAIAKIEAAKKKFDPELLRSSIQNALNANQMMAPSGQGGLTMDVLVTRVRIRSTFNAIMWGAMSGNDAVEGDVVVKDSSGKILDKLSVNASYALGGFAGGQDAARTGWLYEAFAKEVVGQYKVDAKGDSNSSANK